MCDECSCNGFRGYVEKWDGPHQLCKAVINDKRVFVPSRCLNQFTKDTNCHKCLWYGGQIITHRFLLLLQSHPTRYTMGAAITCRIVFDGHGRPIERAPKKGISRGLQGIQTLLHGG